MTFENCIYRKARSNLREFSNISVNTQLHSHSYDCLYLLLQIFQACMVEKSHPATEETRHMIKYEMYENIQIFFRRWTFIVLVYCFWKCVSESIQYLII